MLVLILSFEKLSRKCTEDISWNRDLEFQQKFNIVDGDAYELKKELCN